ncbi:NAD-dependent epimerase/dehydratase family protein [Leptothrix sp. BB-4]
MKILVTGAGGFLGARIVRSLLAMGQKDLRCQIREGRGADKLAALAREHHGAQVEVVACNLLSPADTVALLQGVDLIVHAAAGTRGAAADMMLNTVVATRNLLDAMVEQKVRRLAVVSSFAVYNTEVLADGALLDERSPTEAQGVAKGAYAYSKVRQEQLVLDYQRRHGFEHVFIRPGVIYGDGGSPFSSRVGIRALGWFFSLGGSVLLPLTHVDNCADAVAVAALNGEPGGIFNAVDDDLPTCRHYLDRYRREVQKLRVFPMPYAMLAWGAKQLLAYNQRSKGQLPAVLTPYVVRSMYRPLRYDNGALKRIGWRQAVSTKEGLDMTMRALKAQLERLARG